jgi:CheY-like chemotaxis protein
MTYLERFSPHMRLALQYANESASSRAAGYEIVRTALRQLDGSVSFLPGVFSPRMELLRRVHTVFETMTESGAVRVEPGPGDMETSELAGLPNPARQAVFLNTVAGLTDEQAGLVLGFKASVVRSFIDFAEELIWANSRVRALIVEDDIWIANDLHDILKQDGHEVVGIAETRAEAISLTHKTRPDLLVCDVHLKDGSNGIHFAIEVQKTALLPTLFITASPNEVSRLTPLSFAAVIPKPFSEQQVRAGVAYAIRDKAAA